MKKDCIFCKIINKEIPGTVLWQNKKHVAILDNQPNMEGMTLVLTKKHYPSYSFDMPEAAYMALMKDVRKVAKLIDKGLGTKRTAMVMEGMGIDHVHIKLYPLPGLKNKFAETWAKKKVFFKKYPGYIDTRLGPKRSVAQLKKTAKKMKRK